MNEIAFMLILAVGVLIVYCCMKFFHRIWNRMEEDMLMSESDEQKEK
jgi:hypothetical protein